MWCAAAVAIAFSLVIVLLPPSETKRDGGDGPSLQLEALSHPALGTVRPDGSVRWWPGLSGAIALLPVVRRGALWEALGVLRTALRARVR